jgi:hypothetical protein
MSKLSVGHERRFFFHIRDGATLIRDPDGAYVADLASAKAEAILDARALMSQSIVECARIGLERQIEIADQEDRTVLVVPFSEAVGPLSGFGISRDPHHECAQQER